MLFSALGVSKQVEILFIILSGICTLALDSSPFHVRQDLEEIWNYEFDPHFHKNHIDLYLKYLLCGVTFVRAFTIHIFLAMHIVMLWPTIFADRPNLLIPWLAIGLLRSVLANIVTLATGTYVCLYQKGYQLICLDFILSQIIEHGPSVYAWFTVLNYYVDLLEFCEDHERRKSLDSELTYRRRKVRCITALEGDNIETLSDQISLRRYLSDCTFDSLFIEPDDEESHQVLRTRSLESLQKVKLVDDVSKDGNNEKFKNMTVSERAMKMLNLTKEDIDIVKSERMKVLSRMIQDEEEEKLSDKDELMEERLIHFVSYTDVADANIGDSEEVVQIYNMKGVDVGCQVNTLSRNIINLPPEEVTRKFQFVKKIVIK